MNAIERIRQFIDYQQISERKFFLKTGLPMGAFNKVKSIGSENLQKIFSTYPELNMHWIITGNGEMLNFTTMITKNIKFLLDKSKLNTTQFAERFKTDKTSVEAWINGYTKPTIKQLEAISNKYDLPLHWLMGIDISNHVAYDDDKGKIVFNTPSLEKNEVLANYNFQNEHFQMIIDELNNKKEELEKLDEKNRQLSDINLEQSLKIKELEAKISKQTSGSTST